MRAQRPYGRFLCCSNYPACSYTRDTRRGKGQNYKSAVAVLEGMHGMDSWLAPCGFLGRMGGDSLSRRSHRPALANPSEIKHLHTFCHQTVHSPSKQPVTRHLASPMADGRRGRRRA